MAKVRKTAEACPVRISEGLFAVENLTLVETLREVTGQEKPRVLLVADQNVVQRTENLGTRIGKYVKTHGIELAGVPLVLGGGEKVKSDNLQSLSKVISSALEAKVGKEDALMVLGGGSVLDVAGYAAAQVRGGLKLVRVPTTLAAMVDTAFATTAALNGNGIKDSLRLPSVPAAVLIDPFFTRTILDGVWRGGLGEIIRQAAVCDAPLLRKIVKNMEALKKRDKAVSGEVLADIVALRQKKEGTDFALWSALRLETMSSYKLPHGYAVPIAICIECAYAVKKGLLKESDQEFICRALVDCGALDGLSHSHHLLSQPEIVLQGLDSWRLSTGTASVTLPAGIGKSALEASPDREIYSSVMKELLAASTGA